MPRSASRNPAGRLLEGLLDHRPSRPEGDRTNDGARFYNDAESPLSWLRSRRDKMGKPLLSGAQFLAGERLRADYERSMLASRVTASWDPSASASQAGGNRAQEVSDAALAARQRYHKAIAACGPELAPILVQVCCLEAGMEQAERALDLPQRSGKAVLGLALTSLARHYGLLQETSTARRAEHWSMPGTRPRIQVPEEA